MKDLPGGDGGRARSSSGVFEKKNSCFFRGFEIECYDFLDGVLLGGALSLETSPMATLYLTKVEDYG